MAAYPPPPDNSGHPMAPGYGPGPQQPPPYGGPPPPAYGGAPPVQVQHNTQTTAVVVTTPSVGVTTGIRFGETPVPMTCYYCSASIVTGTQKKSGSFAWMICGVICLVGCFVGVTWCGCCLIPFCVDSMKDTEHYCPNCTRLLGKHSKL